MYDALSIMQAVVPDISAAFSQRILILQTLKEFAKPVGRRTLAKAVDLSERQLRTIIDIMRENQLVTVSNLGIELSNEGERLLLEIDFHWDEARRLTDKEEQLKQVLGIERCDIVHGDADLDKAVYSYLSQRIQQIFQQQLPIDEAVVAVTGGTTLAQVGQGFDETLSKNRRITFVPARGGVGGSYRIQSNSVAGLMAQQSNGQYIPLFLPEKLEEYTADLLLKDPNIQSIIDQSKNADCLILSVGAADVMAKRRLMTKAQYQYLKDNNAVGEAFGVFYNQQGEKVMRLSRYGMVLDDLERIPLLLTVVAGSSKAHAVESYFKLAPKHSWLICDEGVANRILRTH